MTLPFSTGLRVWTSPRMSSRPTPRDWGAVTDRHLQMLRTSGSPAHHVPQENRNGKYPPNTVGRVNLGDGTKFLSPERDRDQERNTWSY